VYGDEYPEGVDPHSYVSRTELERFAVETRVGEGSTLADIGCGRAGPGLWVAMATGARLVGIDIAENALAAARMRAAAMKLGERAEFRQGSFDETGLAEGAVDAVMSVDALLFAVDKSIAVREMRRIIRPGGRLVFTSWDYHSQPLGRPPQVDDHRPLLSSAGFEVLAYEETIDWRRRIVDTTAGRVESVEELAAEIGETVENLQTQLEDMQRTIDAMHRRIFAVAEARCLLPRQLFRPSLDSQGILARRRDRREDRRARHSPMTELA
jgi:ubiquinone/menaquinone biosynthesis C-methylase UbiE